MKSQKRFVYIAAVDRHIWKFKRSQIDAVKHSGCDVTIVCPRGEFSSQFSSLGVRHIHWHCWRDNRNPFLELWTIFHLYYLILKIRPDVVHSFTIRPNLYSCFLSLLCFHRFKLINTVSGLGSLFIESEDGRRPFVASIIDWAYRIAFTRSHAVIFQNPQDLNQFVSNKITSKTQSYLIMSSGVDGDIFRPASPEERQQLRSKCYGCTGPVIILMMARLIQHKGLYEYFECARQLKQIHGDQVFFALLGRDDPGNHSRILPDEFKQLLADFPVQYYGYQETPIFYRAADVYCLPSYREGLSVSIIEAMASGLPIVTTDTPGCRETVDEGENGLLVPVRNTEKLADALNQLILDPSRRRMMGENSRIKAMKEFSTDTVVRQHIQLYSRFVGIENE